MKPFVEHWETIYKSRAPDQVSWFQASADVSLALVHQAGIEPSQAILDVGSGASTFVDGLLARGYSDITLLDVSEQALGITRGRLGDTPKVRYIVADVTGWQPPRTFALWHDRAVFHFLSDDDARACYRRALGALAPGAHAIIATFALHGPERCSGLQVRRYSAATLAAEMSAVLRPIDSREEVHITPSGVEQPFVYVLFERIRSRKSVRSPGTREAGNEHPSGPPA